MNSSSNILLNATFPTRVACEPIWDRMAVTVFCAFTVIFCLSVVGNGLVIVTIVQQRWMRTVTNLYLLNLAVADLLLSIVCMWPTFLSNFLLKCFPFGNVMCKVLAYLQPVSVTASAYTLAVIAIERYFAICRPLHSRHWQTRSHALRMILLIWVISFLSNLLHLFAYELQTTNIPGQMNCRGAVWSEQTNLLHQAVLTVILYVLPLFIMCLLYGIMIRTLWKGIRLDRGHQVTLTVSNGECGSNEQLTTDSPTCKQRSVVRKFTSSLRMALPTTKARERRCRSTDSPVKEKKTYKDSPTHQGFSTDASVPLRSTHMEQALQAKQRVIRMLIFVVIIFAVCWTPLYAYHLCMSIVNTYAPSYFRHVFDWNIFVCFLTLAYSSSCTNPLLYGFLNRKFRQAFLLAFGCPSARTALAVDLGARYTISHKNNSQTSHNPPHIRQPPMQHLSPTRIYKRGESYLSEPSSMVKHSNEGSECNWAGANAIAEADEKIIVSPVAPRAVHEDFCLTPENPKTSLLIAKRETPV